jgi:hypothetical protein
MHEPYLICGESSSAARPLAKPSRSQREALTRYAMGWRAESTASIVSDEV